MMKEKTQADKARIIAQVHFKHGGKDAIRKLPLVDRLLVAKECVRIIGDRDAEKKIDALILSKLPKP